MAYSNKNIGLVITTCNHYYTNIPQIIKDLETCEFPKQNIIVVSGQEAENNILYENNIKIIKVTYSGLHLTGVIHIYENQNLYKNIDYWIILPDTIKIGPNFYNIILNFFTNYINNNIIYSIPFINPNHRQTMDLGIIHNKQIQNMGNYLIKIKLNFPYSKNDILNLKKQLIIDENLILGCPPGKCVPHNLVTKFRYRDPLYKKPNFYLSHKNNIHEEEIIINNKKINKVYLKNLDLIKYQRNYHGLSNLCMTL
jgi:hypothetical protein